MIRCFICLIIMTLLGAVAALFLKHASSSSGLKDLIRNKNLYTGGLLYLLSAVLNVWILRYLPYSVVLPLTSLTYIWTIIFSKLILSEKISKKKVIGVIFIFCGAFCISKGFI